MTWEPGGNSSGFSRQMWFEFIKSFWNFLIWKECQCRQMKHFRPNCSSLPCAMANSFPTIHCLSLLYNLPDPRTSNFQDPGSSRFTIQDFYFRYVILDFWGFLTFLISIFMIMAFRTASWRILIKKSILYASWYIKELSIHSYSLKSPFKLKLDFEGQERCLTS